MSTVRTSMLAGAGAIALAAGVIAPGIASADEAPADNGTDTVTLTNGTKVVATYSATDNGDCTVDFELTNESGSNFRVDYRVDGEDPFFGEADEDDATQGLFRPVLTSSSWVADNAAYDIALTHTTVDLTEDRVVYVGGDEETTTADGVEANEDGEHTVTFKAYSGSPSSAYMENPDAVGQITVTGCPVTEEENNENNENNDSADAGLAGSLASLDLFGSLGGQSED